MNRSVEMPFTEDTRKAPETETVCYCSQEIRLLLDQETERSDELF